MNGINNKRLDKLIGIFLTEHLFKDLHEVACLTSDTRYYMCGKNVVMERKDGLMGSKLIYIDFNSWNEIRDTFSLSYIETQYVLKEWLIEHGYNEHRVSPDRNVLFFM